MNGVAPRNSTPKIRREMRSRSSETRSRERGTGRRTLAGWTCLHGIHLFPATLALLPVIGLWRAVGASIETRAPRLARGAQISYYAFATLCAISLGRIVPFLAPADWILAAAAAIGVAIATSSRIGVSPWWAATLGLALPLALAPPMPPSVLTRIGIFVVAASAMLTVLTIIGKEVRRQASPLAWAYVVLTPALAFRIVLFWLLPSAQPEPILDNVPGLVEVVVRPGTSPSLGTRGLLPINHDDLRLVVQGCETDDRLVGTLHSLYLRQHGEWRRVGYPPGDRIELDCERGLAWVPEMVQEKLWSIDLEDLEIDKPFEACEFAGPTLIRFNQERTALYGFPNGTYLARYDPENGDCEVRVHGGVIVSYSVDEERGEAIIARNGSIEVCPIRDNRPCGPTRELLDPALPTWLQRGFLNRPFFVVHYNKIVQDPVTDAVLATSLHSGRLYRLDRETLEPRSEVFLERGIRWVNIDVERRRIFVGGFVRGTLFVLDADTLEVLASTFVGRKIRYLEPTREGTLLVAASTGALEIDVDALISAQQPRAAHGERLQVNRDVPRINALRAAPRATPGG